MSDIISLEEHSLDIYLAAAKKVGIYTPQLFTIKDFEQKSIQSHGSSVLIKHGQLHFMVTAMHCVFQNETQIKIGIRNGLGQLRAVTGPMVMFNGENDDVDLALIKLNQESVESLLESYEFLDMSKMCQSTQIYNEADFLIFGHPISKTSIDNKRRKIKLAPFIHIGKSAKEEIYPKLLFRKEGSTKKFHFLRRNNTLIHFHRRKGTVVGSNEMSMSPHPKGISGCGIWHIPYHVVSDPREAKVYLAGIIIEHDLIKRYLIASNTENIAYLFRKIISMTNDR